MTRIRFMAAIFFVGLCIVLTGVDVGGQQQPPQQLPGTSQAGGEPQPIFGPPPPATRLEAIASQKGVLITKGYTDVGEVQADDGSRLRLTAVSFTDARQSREAGLVVSVAQRGDEGGGETGVIAYVDAEELDALSEALDALARMDPAAGPMANVESVYRTRGDLEFTNHVSSGGGRVVTVRAAQILYPSGQTLQAGATFRPARLAEIRQQIAAARETINRPQEPAGK